MQRPIPFLRWLAAILAAIVVLRIAGEPRIVGHAVGTTPIFNWLLWGYGIPALRSGPAASLLRRRGDDAPLRMVEAAAILFTVLLAFMEIRHAVNNGDVYRRSADLTEVALQVCVALAMAIGLERLRVRTRSIIHNVGAGLLTVFAGVATLFGLLVLDKPGLWRSMSAARSSTCCCSATPCLRCSRCCCPMRWRAVVPPAYANTIAAGALVLALAYVTLQIRRDLSRPGRWHTARPPAPSNTPTRSRGWRSAWCCSASAFSSTRSARGWRPRSSSHSTILKAFLIDMSALTGVYRALSFMCLGLVLVAIGWLYQRILFSPAGRRRSLSSLFPAAPRGQSAQATLTELRNWLTSSLSRLLSLDSDFAAERTCAEADPVSVAPCCTSVMLEETCCVPFAACWMLREISCVAAPCSSTRRRDGRGNLRHAVDGAADLPDRRHRILGRGLDADDLLADLAGRLRGLLGERLHLGCHHRKAAAGFAGARGLDRGVERQQIGLAGNGVDQFDHVADAACRLRQLADAVVGLPRLVHGFAGHARRFLDLTADLVDGGGQLLAVADDTDCTLVEASSEAAATIVARLLSPFSRLGQRIGGGFKFGRSGRHGLDDLSDRAFERIGELRACPPCAVPPAALRRRAARRAAAPPSIMLFLNTFDRTGHFRRSRHAGRDPESSSRHRRRRAVSWRIPSRPMPWRSIGRSKVTARIEDHG